MGFLQMFLLFFALMISLEAIILAGVIVLVLIVELR